MSRFRHGFENNDTILSRSGRRYELRRGKKWETIEIYGYVIVDETNVGTKVEYGNRWLRVGVG